MQTGLPKSSSYLRHSPSCQTIYQTKHMARVLERGMEGVDRQVWKTIMSKEERQAMMADQKMFEMKQRIDISPDSQILC